MLYGIFKRKQRVESPKRIKAFQNATKNLDWNNVEDSLSKLYIEINLLIEAEIEYYYKRRVSKRRLSNFLRIMSLIFFGIGGLFPLISSASSMFSTLNEWGYVLLGFGAIFLSADKVFTGSSGHVRYVVTQLTLEQHLTIFRIKWQKMMAKNTRSEISSNEIFDELEKFTESFYKVLLNETDEWKNEIAQAIKELSKQNKIK